MNGLSLPEKDSLLVNRSLLWLTGQTTTLFIMIPIHLGALVRLVTGSWHYDLAGYWCA